jgi:hypothetical protein
MALYVSDLLTATAAPVNASPAATRTWQWLRGSSAISGATSATYTAVTADIGATLSASQLETNFLGTATATSAASETVQAFDPIRLFSASEPGVWYDPGDITTLFKGPTVQAPVTAPGDEVWLMLDKSRGLVLGAELVTNGDFSNGSTGWNLGAGVTVSGGKANMSAASGYVCFRSGVSGVAVGGYYEFTFTISGYVSGSIQAYVGATAAFGPSVSANGTYTVRLGPIAGSEIGLRSLVAFTGSIDDISVKAVTGNHATQSITASQPIYGIVPFGGRRNLLEYTDQLDNAYWIKNNITVSANATTSPDGTNTADLIYATATSTTAMVSKILSTSSSRQTQNWYVKAAGRSIVWMSLDGGADITYFNLATQAVTPSGNHNAVITPLANDWFDISISNKVATGYSWVGTIGICDVVGSPAVVVNGTNGIYATGGQRELSATATAYQRVTTQYDVTEAGVQSLSYLSFDGVDDFMLTGTITPGVDKVQVFAGVRKNSDALESMLLEFSVNSNTNNGSFQILGPDSSATSTYRFYARGDTANTGYVPTGYAAPITNVIASLMDLAGADRATEVIPRINGVLAQVGAAGSGAAGGGNFLAYPLYLGRRAGTSLPASMSLFGLITRFGPNLASTNINATEYWLNEKTGAY